MISKSGVGTDVFPGVPKKGVFPMAHVLVVDDSWLSRQFLCGMLKKDGHWIQEADSGPKALAILEKSSPDVVLLDLLMPEMDGYAVLEILGEKKIPIPVLVITADIQETTRVKCRSLGAAGFINKPCDPDELRSMVRRTVENTAKGGP